ncbi:MAG: hypothetical protein A2749_02495 [Parcubacteria group bacterium RIFCSPHIGHO2_01_FULL_45_26]|nr:MAG: hypothetical protein A2749_02495 [Parcubacteria group bacterium RIFCSPHIGHO2_01_FULL_45_26]
MSKLSIRLGIVVVLIAVGGLITWFSSNNKSSNNHFSDISIKELSVLSPDYLSVLAKITSPDGKHLVVFAVTDEGNKNDYGDIVLINKSYQMKKIGNFNTSSDGFAETLEFISPTNLRYIEAINNGGGIVDSTERTIDIANQ